MSKQAIVGLFTLLGLGAFFAVYYVLADIGTKSRGYKVGIHFTSAAGLRPGAIAYESGVPIGVIDRIELQKDFTVGVIVAVKKEFEIPTGSRYIIAAPLTGDPNLVIVPSASALGAAPGTVATLPHEILPIDQQPRGTDPLTIADLLQAGQGEIRRFDTILAQLEKATPVLLGSLQSTLKNANELTVSANQSIDHLAKQTTAVSRSLSRTIDVAGTNILSLTSTLDTTTKRDVVKVDELLVSLSATSRSLSQTVDALRALSQNSELKDNLVAASRSLALTTKTTADLAGDLRTITANPDTQAQLRDTIAHIDATAQKLDSLLGGFGGKSRVKGVDGGAPPAGQSPKLTDALKDLATLQLRLSVLSAARTNAANVGAGSPLLNSDRGPQTDLNLIVLPNAKTTGFGGVNDLGDRATYNIGVLERVGALRLGGGVLYSRLGALAQTQGKRFGAEARAYDPRHPTVDLYGRFFVSPQLELFAGERDVLHKDRRTVFGLQLQP